MRRPSVARPSVALPSVARPLVALAVLSGVLAVLVHELLFVHGSIDNDEVVYLLQARLIASGHLLLHTPSPAVAYQPWFFAPGPHGLVPKYWPTVGALMGLSFAVTGSVLSALVVEAMALPLLMFGFCRGFLSPRRSLLAASVLALSPLVVIQSGLALSYLPFAAMMLGLWWLLRVLAERPSPGRGFAAGGLFTVALATRPLDTALLTVPPAIAVARSLWRAESSRRSGSPWLPLLGALAGTLPGLILLAWYDDYATGGILTLPFNALDSRDTLGFGQRELFPEDGRHYFGPRQSLDGFASHFLLAPLTWFAAGLVVVPLAILAVTRWRTLGAELRWLALATGTFLVGYLYFWGPYNASVLWGGPHTVGPFYALAVLVPVITLACSVSISIERSQCARVVVGVAVGLSAFQLGVGVAHAHRQSGATSTVLAAVAQGRSFATQLSVETGSPYLGHPVSQVLDPVGGRGIVNNAVPPPPHVSAELLQLPGDPYGSGGPDLELVRQGQVSGPTVRVSAGFAPPRRAREPGGVYALLVQQGARRLLCNVGPRLTGRLVVSATAAPSCVGAPSVVPLRLVGASTDGCQGKCVALTLMQFGPGRAVLRVASRHLAERVVGATILVVVDGRPIVSRGGGWLSITGAASPAASTAASPTAVPPAGR